MYDSRKTLINVLLNNLLNVFNLAVVLLIVLLVINQSYFYIFPLGLSLIVSLFNLFVDIKRFVLLNRKPNRVHVLKDDSIQEKKISRLKKGDKIIPYSGDIFPVVGQVRSGVVLVNEKYINGRNVVVRKEVGSNIISGSLVIESSAVVEAVEVGVRHAKKIKGQIPLLQKRMKIFNFLFSSLVLLAILTSFILDSTLHIDSLNNIAESSILAVPFIANIVISIYLFVISKKGGKSIQITDPALYYELNDVDVICVDKTNVITTGEFEIFKTSIISKSAFTNIATSGDRGFEQTVSNILKSTNETGGYYSALQEHFIYDVTKNIESKSSIKENGLYSAITIKGGYTYALGKPENFVLQNYKSALSSISEYQKSGYEVLMLVENKSPLKEGLIDGKCTGIAFIVLQEKVRESTEQLIEYCHQNNKVLKVISSDDYALTTEICRKAKIDDFDKSISLSGRSFYEIDDFVEDKIIFTNALPSQKTYIVRKLKKLGHKVLYIGSGDIDTQVLKTANVAMSMSDSSQNAKRCSQAIIKDDFSFFDNINLLAKNIKNKLSSVLSLLYAQITFLICFVFAFLITKGSDPVVENPFNIIHLWLWILLGNIVPIILILCGPLNKNYPHKGFYHHYIADSLLYIIPIGLIYLFQLIQYFGIGYFGIPSDVNELHEKIITSQVANSLSYLVLLIVSAVMFFERLSPLNKYKTISFIPISIILAAYFVLLGFNVDSLSSITFIQTSYLLPVHYLIGLIIAISCSAIYLFVLNVIDILKGANDVNNKSNN